MVIQFTAQQAKTARVNAQLSQGRVASDLGINRSYLSQFESGKLLFDDATVNRLRDYYMKREAGVESLAQVPAAPLKDDSDESNTLRLRDGFLLPPEADEDHVEALLNEYAENRRQIRELCNIDLSNSGFLGFGVDEDKARKLTDDVLGLMARNYTIIEELQGHGGILVNAGRPREGEKKRVSDFVEFRLISYVTQASQTWRN
ncbi:helix-turn-helix domain-containing protein [Nitrosovibrio tenuis]|uniref:Helix-turn-helix domain-containing protein n=1 Tax=Nitrosovibrio tenuis TaxID=1233 RepID=A0A1H7RA80_9PROT|nr:helix-turn-helix transcriptional regulator [Nitrosovibrio tenuis]SEL57103.1 Helix-turn-helix domain-containing protein [Nitrosovibrio tenuis]